MNKLICFSIIVFAVLFQMSLMANAAEAHLKKVSVDMTKLQKQVEHIMSATKNLNTIEVKDVVLFAND